MNPCVYIGWDHRERTAWETCALSIWRRSSRTVGIRPISRQSLRTDGLYLRPTEERDGQLWDRISNEPCSTDFSLARFWVPVIGGSAGWALFCDCDFLFRADVAQLFDLADPRYAVMVVPNMHDPVESVKMDGRAQTGYFRKNWSSLMLWNLGHAGARRLRLHDLNTWHKHDLHGFRWLADAEIGFLPQAWNWLEGISDPKIEPKAVHYTRGTPDMLGYENAAYADEWRAVLNFGADGRGPRAEWGRACAAAG